MGERIDPLTNQDPTIVPQVTISTIMLLPLKFDSLNVYGDPKSLVIS